MSFGPGRYEKETAELRAKIGAAGVILIVCRGHSGDGFEIQMPDTIIALIPTVLREIADKMEADLKRIQEAPKG